MSIKNEKFINPLTDFGFKKLFGSELNQDLLIDFLNELLPQKHQIKDLSYAQNEHQGQRIVDRTAIFDIYCIGKNGERFIVEVQKAKQNYFKDRSVYYASFPIQEQGQKGDRNYELALVYTVGILDFIFGDHKNEDELVHLIELKNQKCEVFYDKLKFIYIELPKFNKSEEEIETHFEKWLYVFTHLSKLQDRPKRLQEKVFEKLFQAAEIAKFTVEEREAYEESLKHYLDIKNVVDTSLEQGKDERSIEIARIMKSDNEDIEKIIRYTGLTEEEIKKL